jgi:type IV secretory pathway VirB10-like protein
MNKLISGIVAIGIYFAFIFLILLYYNVHKQKAKNYVEENSNRVTVTLVNSDKTVFNKRSKINIPKKPVPKHQTENKAHHAITPIPVPIPKRDKIKSNAPSKKEILAKKRAKREKLRKAKREKLAKKRKEEAKKKREAQKLARLEKIKKEREEKKKKKKRKSAKSLFASIKTKERPKKEHKRLKRYTKAE